MIRDTQAQVPDLANAAHILKTEMRNDMDHFVDPRVASASRDTNDKLKELKRLVVASMDRIANRASNDAVQADEMRAKMASLERNQMGLYNANGSNVGLDKLKTYADRELNGLRGVMVQMSQTIDELISDTHEDAV
jgi:hypothetical protein